MRSQDKKNYREIKESEIFIDDSRIRKIIGEKYKNWTIGLIIDVLIKNKIMMIKKSSRKSEESRT